MVIESTLYSVINKSMSYCISGLQYDSSGKHIVSNEDTYKKIKTYILFVCLN